ncbi:CaiB/BaiF CoA transferase family protein [Mycobacterium sp. 48b]|uniref:CaiB/BaiF CoA transferase family protein n=1 Tax=Mycobacterium sp. 48b TaxID=3400426 RepID=UPI003AAA540C
MSGPGILTGVRVVELASWTFVPSAGVALSDWGADVVKVESLAGGDPARALVVGGLARANAKADADFMLELGNRGKRSIGLDIKSPAGRKAFDQLLAEADVFLTNWRPGALERARLTVEDVRKINPTIIIARGSGSGVRGPDGEKGGFDAATYTARGGVASTFAIPGYEHLPQQGPAFGDLQSGITLAGGVCGALFHRERTGEPSIVDCSLLAQAMWAIAPSIGAAEMFGVEQLPAWSTPDTVINPLSYRYKTRDQRWIQLVFLQPDRFWPGFCDRMGLSELAHDERFDSTMKLITNAKEAAAILAKAFAEHDLAHWQKALEDEPGVWEIVANPLEVLNDRQVEPNGLMVTNTDDQGREYRVVAAPVQFNETTPAPSRAPEHGQHTEEILLELGWEWDDLADAKDAGAVL